jgi:hypothetical protein
MGGQKVNFKEIAVSKISAYGIVEAQIHALIPDILIDQTAYEFDREIYRFVLVYKQNKRINLDLAQNLLEDLRDNPKSQNSAYSRELIANLNRKIVEAVNIVPFSRTMTAEQAIIGLGVKLSPAQGDAWLKDSRGEFDEEVRNPWE